MINPVNLKARSSGGKGGLWGKIAGGLVGGLSAVAAPFTGGATLPGVAASLPSIAAGMGIGSLAGEALGSAIDPAKVTNPTPLQTVGKSDPGVMLAQLSEASKAAVELPETEAQPIQQHLQTAMEAVKKRQQLLGVG